MTFEEFISEVKQIQADTVDVLEAKADYYHSHEDCFEQFQEISKLTGVPVQVVIAVLVAKHITALYRAIRGAHPVPDELLEDIHNYLYFLQVWKHTTQERLECPR